MRSIKNQNNQPHTISKGQLTTLALALTGALAAMTPVTVQADSLIYGSTVQQGWTGGNFTLTSTGFISPTIPNAAGLSTGASVGSLINNGSITSSSASAFLNAGYGVSAVLNNGGATISGYTAGISNSGSIGSVNNSGGTISGALASGNASSGIYNTGTISTLSNSNGATISGIYGVHNSGMVGTLDNSANIIGSSAIRVDGGTISVLTNTGTILGMVNGIYNDGTITALNNQGGTISASDGYGIENHGTISTLTNSGVVVGETVTGTASGTGIYNAGGTIDTLNNSGTIGGYNNGILNTGSIASLGNTGTIVSSNSGFAVQNGGLIKTLTNSGLITAGTGIYNAGGSISTLSNAGTISGSNVGILNLNGTVDTLSNSGYIGGQFGVFNYIGTIGSITNSGAIASSYIFDSASTGALNSSQTVYSGGIVNLATTSIISNSGTLSNTVTIDNTGSGTVVSGAIINVGTLTSLVNSGLINNSGSVSITNNNPTPYISSAIVNMGTIATITNASGGTISGLNNYGANGPGGFVIQNNGAIGVLNNAGLITGYTALYIDPVASLGTLINTGTIAGDLSNNSTTTALSIRGGSGSNFGTLTGYGGTIGTIISLSSGVTFASGNQLLNDNVTVSSGSGTVTNNATLQVNNPLTITGNYAQSTGSSLIFGVTNPVFNGNATDTGYGRLVVSGDVTLASGSSVSLKTLGYAFAQGQRYVVVAAGGTITNSGVTYSATGYSVSGSIQSDTNVNYSGYSDLVLTLGGTTGNSAINNASNPNAASSLHALFNYSGTDSSLLAVFNPAAALDTPGSANKAGEQLSPGSVRGAANQAAGASNQAVNNVANDRMDNVRVAQNGSSGVATGESVRDIALWGQVFGGRAAQGERDSVSGYHANFRGSLIGVDGMVNDVLRVGGLVSVSNTSVASAGNNTGSSASINNYGVKAYATYDGSPWYVNLQAGVARQMFSTVRAISYTGFSGTAYGDFSGTQYLTSAQAGYPLNLDAWLPGATLTPIAGLSYSNLRQNGYTESGGNGAALTVNGSSSTSLKSELGAKLESVLDSSYGKLLPSVQVGWQHEYRNNATQTGASFAADSTESTAFVAQSASPIANIAVLNLGVTLLRSENLSLTGKYTLEAGGGYVGQTASLLVRWRY